MNVSDISDCPALTLRALIPTDVTDLRVDDIKIFGSLGDRWDHTKPILI